jgi:TPR repeat protein
LGETYKSEEINTILDEQPERVESLRRLTGGVPRTIVLLFEIFLDDLDGNSFKDLEKILDRVTPLYKHRLDNLSTQQQLIIDAIAQNWDAVSTKDIAKKIRMPGKAVSAQLAQLEKNQLIKKISTSTKNFLYQINERFFNIYYLMRQGKRRNRNKVLWLVKFFEIWCSERELVTRTQRHIEALRKGKLYDKHAFYVAQALSKQKIPFELQHELLGETRKYLTSKKSEYSKELDKSHLEVYEEVVEDVEKAYYESAKKKLVHDGIKSEEVNYIIGNILFEKKKDLDRAIQFYLEAIQQGHADSIYNLAWQYQNEFKDIKKAEQYYLKAVEKGDSNAMFNLALMYENEFKDLLKTKQFYLMAVEKGHPGAMNNLASLYLNEYENFEKAEKYYLMAVEAGHIGAIFNLGMIYQTKIKDICKAEQYYLIAIEKGDSGAMNNLALLYRDEFKDTQKAEKHFLTAVKKDDFNAIYNLAQSYYLWKKNKKESLVLIEKAYNFDHEILNACSYILILLWNNEIEKSIEIFKSIFDRDEAQKEVNENIYSILLMFIAKKQYQLIYHVFIDNKFNIRDKYKPIFFALLSLMGEEYADEFKKMGGELKETVEEIIEEINRLSVDYA